MAVKVPGDDGRDSCGVDATVALGLVVGTGVEMVEPRLELPEAPPQAATKALEMSNANARMRRVPWVGRDLNNSSSSLLLMSLTAIESSLPAVASTSR